MATPVPVLLCGKFSSHVEAVSNAVKPGFEVARHASNTEDAVGFLSDKSKAVRLVVMGGGFSMAEYEVVRAAPGAKAVPWVRPAQTKPAATTGLPSGGAPPAETVAARVKECLEEHAEQFREDGSVAEWREGDVWYF